jgi:hypothetical protein
VTRTADCVLRTASIAAVLACASAPLRPCAAQTEPRLVAIVRLAQEGMGDSARAEVRRLLAATTTSSPLYPEALFTSGVVAATTAEMERHFQRLVVEHNGSPWADDALLRLAQLSFARGDHAAVGRHTERLAGDYPASEVLSQATVWAAQSAFRSRDMAGGCRWLALGISRVDTLNVELVNSLQFLNGRCGGAAQRDSGAATPSPVAPVTPRIDSTSVTRPERGVECPHGCWSVQVASSSTQALADDAVARLAREGFPDAYRVRDGGTFKVRVGPLSTRAEADALLARIRVRYTSAFVVQEGR